MSFTHGVPEASGLSAVTFAQDHRLSRALLERAGVQIPKGASFSWRSIQRAGRWATRLGYPVALREGVGEKPARSVRHINSDDELRKAFSELRLRDKADRAPGSNPLVAGYATTRLTFTLDEEGNEVAPLRSRMLVEEDPAGRALRAFVVGGRVVAVVELDDDQTSGVTDVTGDVPDAVADVFVLASEAIPGLACATVDVLWSVESTDRPVLVTGVSERPRAETFAVADDRLSEVIGSAVFESQASSSSLTLGPQLDDVSCRLQVEGLRQARRVADILPEVFAEHDVDFVIARVDEVTGDLEATVAGSPGVLAALIELLMAGELADDKAAAIETSKGPVSV
ncbi:hypothetical protein [Nesterenkonia marinintestina]|uniref:hypothetical protein n=1 Tax=Nesterenkonia marinintestina TaxID=2979865 RepID=UPI0021BF2EA6|nr:hypothetical protein [Nesterenkonia sp. GX14115]